MADLRDLESLRVVAERASAETAPPPFTDLAARARVRRRRRAGGAAVLAAVAVVAAVGLGTCGRALVGGHRSVEPPAATTPAKLSPAAQLSPSDPRADAVVAKGDLNNYAVDQHGDLLSTWVSCPDTSTCRNAWRLVRADGASTAGMYPGRMGGPHVSAGPDYFVVAAVSGPQLLVHADGSTGRVPAAGAGASESAESGAASVATRDGVRLVDPQHGWLELPAPSGRPWGDLEVAADGTVWGVDQPGPGERATVAWRPTGSDWQQEPLTGVGTAVLVRSGDRVAALTLDASSPTSETAVPSFGRPSDFAVTTDAGATWTRQAPDRLPFDSLESWAVTADGALLVSDGERVYRTTDGTWLRFAPVADAVGLNRLQGGGAEHPDRVYGYSYDEDRLYVLTSAGAVHVAERQLR
jgi:hypothetical protein